MRLFRHSARWSGRQVYRQQPGAVSATTTYSSGGTNAIIFKNLTVTNSEVYLNLPIPTTNLSTLSSISITSNSSPSYTTQRDISGWSTIAHAQGKKATASFVSVSFLTGYDGSFKGGLYISSGILKYDGNANTGSHGYTLTSGENPLELLDYCNQSSAVNVYYHAWNNSTVGLKYRIDGNNTKADIAGLISVDGELWRIPTQTEWSNFVSTSSYTSKVNTTGGANTRVFKCHVNLSTATNVCGNDSHAKGMAASGYQDGLVLIPEYVSITCPGISTYTLTTAFATNTIPWTSLKKLVEAGCIFLPAAGLYLDKWYDVGTYGYYWAKTQFSDNDERAMNLFLLGTDVAMANNQKAHCYPVRLVRAD